MGEKHDLTRRAVLGRAAAAGAVALVRPEIALALAPSKSPRISSLYLGRLSAARVLSPPQPFALVGVEWERPATARIELRSIGAGGRTSPWVPASTQGHDPDGPARVSPRFGEPVWTGGAQAVELRSGGPVDGVRVHFVGVSTSGGASAAAGFPLAQPVLDAGPGQPPIIARPGWAQGHAPVAHLAGYGTVELAFVHHTVSANGYSADQVPSMLRGIFDYHRYVRDYLDIAYNFLIDAYGRIWEGRAGGIDMAVIGAHAGGYNAESTGVAILGDYMNVVPTVAALNALDHLLAWKLSLHGIPIQGKTSVIVDPDGASYTPFSPGAQVSLPRVAGHRDGDLTDCPGNALYGRLPAIRRRAAALAGAAAKITFQAPSAPATATSPVALNGQLSRLDGSPVAGAALELQQLIWDLTGPTARTRTIATTESLRDGSWSTQATLSRNVILRILSRTAPATVSDWNQIDVAPLLALQLQSTSPLRVLGGAYPHKAQVTVELYRASAPNQPLATRKLAPSGRLFVVSFGTRATGDYILVARTKADKTNAAGTSAPLNVTIS